MNKHRIRLWDLPTRLFHWSLAVLVGAAIVSGEIGGNLIDWHGRFGIAIAGLVAFRLVWGLVGSHTARFSSFVRGPAAIKAYLRGEWHGIGHNPLGALSVLCLLTLLALQVGTGLFANDDISFQGPLAALISKELSNTFQKVHEISLNLLLVVLGLHIAAIVFYARVKGENLLLPMLTGKKTIETTDADVPENSGGRWPALLLALAIAAAVGFTASGAWISQSPLPPQEKAAAPTW
jgi:cytochrome b